MLEGTSIAILAEDNYQVLELWYPFLRLREAGADVKVVGSGRSEIHRSSNGYPVRVDLKADEAEAEDFDAVIVPGGYAPDRMRRIDGMLSLVKGVDDRGGVVASICHGAWVLVSADVLQGRTATCVSAIKDDVANAGAAYVDEEVVVDGNLITSRIPSDLPAFCQAIIEALS